MYSFIHTYIQSHPRIVYLITFHSLFTNVPLQFFLRQRSHWLCAEMLICSVFEIRTVNAIIKNPTQSHIALQWKCISANQKSSLKMSARGRKKRRTILRFVFIYSYATNLVFSSLCVCVCVLSFLFEFVIFFKCFRQENFDSFLQNCLSMYACTHACMPACLHDINSKNMKIGCHHNILQCSNVPMFNLLLPCYVVMCNIQNIIRRVDGCISYSVAAVIKSVHCSSIMMLPLALHTFRLCRKRSVLNIIPQLWLLNIPLPLTSLSLLVGFLVVVVLFQQTFWSNKQQEQPMLMHLIFRLKTANWTIFCEL